MNGKQRRAIAHAAKKGHQAYASGNTISKDKPPPKKPRKRISQARTTQGLKWIWKVIVAMGVFAGIFGFLYQFRPQLKIERDITLDSKDPFATRFSVSNTSPLTFTNLIFACVVDAPPMIKDVRISGSSDQAPVTELRPGEEVTRGCGIKANGFPLNAALRFRVTYEVLGLGEQIKETRFRSKMDAQQNPQWFHDSN